VEILLFNSSSDKSSILPVLIIFCSIYNPAAAPRAFSALAAAEKDLDLVASSLILANSARCPPKEIPYFLYFSSRSSPMCLNTKG